MVENILLGKEEPLSITPLPRPPPPTPVFISSGSERFRKYWIIFELQNEYVG